eukprot:11120022-Alexandrium_andersonii.AAC.1
MENRGIAGCITPLPAPRQHLTPRPATHRAWSTTHRHTHNIPKRCQPQRLTTCHTHSQHLPHPPRPR